MARTKPTRRIWHPEQFETVIGSGTYIIEPQPIERIIEFDGMIKQLSDGFSGLSTTYYIEQDGKDIDGPFEDVKTAEGHMNGTGTSIREQGVGIREVLSSLVNAPYPALQVLIPDLKEEDVRQSSVPNLMYIMDLLVEVNGIEWFETFLKNSLGPLLPEIMQMVFGSIREMLTTDQEIVSGEKA